LPSAGSVAVIAFHWFLPTSGDSRDIVGGGDFVGSELRVEGVGEGVLKIVKRALIAERPLYSEL